MSVPADTPADRPAGLAIEVVAALLAGLADLRATNEKLTRELGEAYDVLGPIGAGGAPAGLVPAIHNLSGMYEKERDEAERLRAEVERLTAERDEAVKFWHMESASVVNADAELAALRQALADLVAYDDAFQEWAKMRPSDGHSKKVSQGEKASALLHSAIDQARAALGGTQ